MKSIFACLAICLFVISGSVHAQSSQVVGGDTTVLLDTALLSTAASLEVSGIGNGATATAEGVVFGINERDAAVLPTTFAYTPGSFAPFSGTIEHLGTVLFNDDSVVVGDFTIGFDASRATGPASGFFVESTTGIEEILFDVGGPVPDAQEFSLSITGDLLVSNEFATFLSNNSLATSDLTGADVGNATINAVAIPEPTSIAVLSFIGLVGLRRRSR